MKQLIFILMAALMLIECKAKQTVVNETTTASLIDTTKTVTDTTASTTAHVDTTKTAQHVEQSATIEFVDGGGTVTIDTMGNVTLQGVKNIKGSIKADRAEVKGVADSVSTYQAHSQTANARTETTASHSERSTKTSRAIRWYERPLIWIGSLCCIAVLLWLIFIYIHKKH